MEDVIQLLKRADRAPITHLAFKVYFQILTADKQVKAELFDPEALQELSKLGLIEVEGHDINVII